MDVNELDTLKLRDLLQQLEFRSLLNKLPQHMQNNEPVVRDSSLDPAERLSGSEANAVLMMARELVVWPVDGELWLSHERGKVVKLSLAEAKDILLNVPIIAHDAKKDNLLRFIAYFTQEEKEELLLMI